MRRRQFLASAAKFSFYQNVMPPTRLLSQALTTNTFDVQKFGAKGDGATLDTVALQRAIDTCANEGGGIVRVPTGRFLTGTLFLRNHVSLYLAEGAVVVGSTNLANYAAQSSTGVGKQAQGSLIAAFNTIGSAILGEGQIDGSGPAFWSNNERHKKPNAENEWTDVAMFYKSALPRPGPLINFEDCKQLRVQGITIRNSPAWTLRVLRCADVTFSHLQLNNPRFGPNTDGIDITCSSDVLISDCKIVTGDDAICLKSEGKDADRYPTRNILVRRCSIDTNCNGLKIGTGSQGLFDNIRFDDCTLSSRYHYVGDRMISAFALEAVDGGQITNVTVNNISVTGARTPIFVRLGNRGRGQETPTPGSISNVTISNVQASGAEATSSICGIPGSRIKAVSLKNIDIRTQERGSSEWLTRTIPEEEAVYPEARMFGRLPSSGLYCRHVDILTFEDLRFEGTSPDPRPALHLEDVHNAQLSKLSASAPEGDAAVIRLIDVKRAKLRDCTAPQGSKAYVEATDSPDVTFLRCNLKNAATPLKRS